MKPKPKPKKATKQIKRSPKAIKQPFESLLLTPGKQQLSGKITNIILCWGAITLWLIISKWALSFVPYPIFHLNVSYIGRFDGNDFAYSCIFAPLIEEVMFRAAPIEILRRTGLLKQIGIPVILFISIVFGLMHGDASRVFVQGICGLALSWLYIKNGFSYASTVTVHFLWNFTLTIALPYIVK